MRTAFKPTNHCSTTALSHFRLLHIPLDRLHRFNELRLDMDEDSPYINSGVMLMNLQALRAEQDTQAVFDYMDAHKGRLMLPDQDIISALYGQRILPLDPIRYNMTESCLPSTGATETA